MNADGSVSGACAIPSSNEFAGVVTRRRTIAFTTDRDGNREIYVMDADGGNREPDASTVCATATTAASSGRPTGADRLQDESRPQHARSTS